MYFNHFLLVLIIQALIHQPLLLRSWELDHTKQLEYLLQLNGFKLDRVLLEEWFVNKYSPPYWRRNENFIQPQYIDLEFYHIDSIEPDTFTDFDKLRFLSLGNNRLTSLSGGTFTNMRQLDRLILRNNMIGVLDGNMLNDLNQLRYLDLENNQIASITNGFVRKFNRLCITDFYFFNNKCDVRTVRKLEIYQDYFAGRKEFRPCVRIRGTSCNVL